MTSADCAERLERSWNDNVKEMQTLIVDPSGIIIGQVAYRCALCRQICDSVNDATVHYQVDHIQVAVNVLRNSASSHSDSGSSSMLPSTSAVGSRNQTGGSSRSENNRGTQQRSMPQSQTQRIQARIKSRQQRSQRDRMMRDKMRANQRTNQSSSLGTNNRPSARNDSLPTVANKRQTSNNTSSRQESHKAAWLKRITSKFNSMETKNAQKETDTPPKISTYSRTNDNRRGPRTRSTNSLLSNSIVKTEAIKKEESEQRSSSTSARQNVEDTDNMSSSQTGEKTAAKRLAVTPDSDTSPRDKVDSSTPVSQPSARDATPNSKESTRIRSEHTRESRSMKTRSSSRSSSASDNTSNTREDTQNTPAKSRTPQTPVSTRSLRTSKRKRVENS